MPRGKLAKGKRLCSVYLVQDEHGRTKIGRAYDPEIRRASIQTGNSGKVELVHHWRTSVARAVEVEGTLHRLFRPSRTKGEWHDVLPGDVYVVAAKLLTGDADGAAELAAAIAAADAALAVWVRHRQSATRRSRIWRETTEAAHEVEDARLEAIMQEADTVAAAAGRTPFAERWSAHRFSPKGERVA